MPNGRRQVRDDAPVGKWRDEHLSDKHTRRCEAINRKQEQCSAYALRDSDPPRCYLHAMSAAEVDDWRKKARKAANHKRRVAADAKEASVGFADGVTLQMVLDACVTALDAKIEYTHEIDHGARLSACAILLQTFPKSLRTTPDECRMLLHHLLDGTRHEDLADQEPPKMFAALRREWIDTRTRVDSLGQLYSEPVPSWMLAPGETKTEVMRREGRDFSGWRVLGVEHPTHALVADDKGREQFVPKDVGARVAAD